MCVVVFNADPKAAFPFILMHNRDEYYERPAAPVHPWLDPPGLIGGKDIKSGGMWLGFSKSGRFALVTNYRDPKLQNPAKKTRGALVRDFLAGSETAQSFLRKLEGEVDGYNPFNLIVGESYREFYYLNSLDQQPQKLSAGLYGLSNSRLETPWFKVKRAKHHFEHCLKQLSEPEKMREQLLFSLRDAQTATNSELPDTGVGVELERQLSSIFVRLPKYGTVASTVATVNASGEVVLIEQPHSAAGSGFPVEYNFRIGFDYQ